MRLRLAWLRWWLTKHLHEEVPGRLESISGQGAHLSMSMSKTARLLLRCYKTKHLIARANY